MKEHKSHMSMVARFAYIFATIVTVFAQIGSAVPALIAEADDTPKAYITTENLSLDLGLKDGFKYTMYIDGTKPANGQSFKVNLLGKGFTLLDSQTNIANGQEVLGDYGGKKAVYSGWIIKKTGDHQLTITRNDSYKGTDAPNYNSSSTVTPWPITLKFLISADDTGGISLDGQDTPLVMNEANTLALSVFNNGPTTYQVGDEVDLQLNDQNMIDGGEVDVSKAAVSQYLKYDPEKTAALLKKQGYTQYSGSASDVSAYADDASSATITKYAKSDTDYFYLLENNGDARVVWPPTESYSSEDGADIQRNALIAMQAVGETSSVNLTPTYLSSALKGQDGTGVDLTIKAAPDVDGSVLRLDPHSVANDNPAGTGTYRISTFPLFYMKETADNGTQLYSFLYNFYSTGQNGNPTHSLETLRKAIIAGDPYTSIKGGAESTTNTEPAYFENFHAIGSDGYAIANSEKRFDIGKTYTLIPYNPVTAGSDRFKRIDTTYQSHNYYMPDGVPTFSVNASGQISLQSAGDGKAVKGQWKANGSTIEAALYKVKKLAVVDQNGDPVADAKLKLKNTTSGDTAYMQATTGSDGSTGEFLPNDYDDATQGPFYYADGTQAFDSLTLPSGYSQDVAFSGMTIGKTDDKLTLSSDKKNAAISDDGQTLTITVHKYDDSDSQINIKKVSQADPTKVLGGAKFKVEEVDGASDAIESTDVTTADDTGLASVSVDSASATAKRVFHVTETQAPTGFSIANPNGYYATWTKGSGFTTVGDTKDATGTQSTDKLALVDGGQLIIQDPKAYGQGGSDSKLRIQYMDAAEYNNPGAGTKIAGAQLPVINPAKAYAGTGTSGFKGLGGVVYNPDTNPNTLMKADSGVTTGTLANDSSMYTSAEKSGVDGYGYIQGLWSQTGVVYGWEGLDQNTNGWILNNAIVNGTIPSTPEIDYQLISPTQRKRAVGTTASGYYNLGSTLKISGDQTGMAQSSNNASGSNKYNGNDRDNPAKADGNTLKVELYKVKYVQVVDAVGRKVSNAVVKFSNMTATTGADGSIGELLPNDANNQPTTSGENFVFPNSSQKLQSVTDSSGKAMVGADDAPLTSANGFAFEMQTGGVDKLRTSVNGTGSDVTIDSTGQVITIKVKTVVGGGGVGDNGTNGGKLTIKKVDANDRSIDVPDGAKFNVKQSMPLDDKYEDTQKTTDGKAVFDLGEATNTDKVFTITETVAPSGYAKNTKTYSLRIQPDGTMTLADSGMLSAKILDDHTPDNVITFVSSTDHTLVYGDTKAANDNGGIFSLKKIDGSNAVIEGIDGATFQLTEAVGSGQTGVSSEQATANGGIINFDLGAATNTTRSFTLTERAAPVGYVWNTKQYAITISPKGEVSVGVGKVSDKPTLSTTQTDDEVLSVDGKGVTFADEPVTTQKNGGELTIKKVDANDRTKGLAGAVFAPSESVNDYNYMLGSDPNTGITTDDQGDFTLLLGQPTKTVRKIMLGEAVAPKGYNLAKGTYWLMIDPDGKITVSYQGTKGGTETTPASATPDGVLQVDSNNQVTFSDTPVASASFSIKKTQASDPTQGVTGTAKFEIYRIDPSTWKTTSEHYNVETTDGKIKSTSLQDQSLTDGYFSIKETQAPSGYTKEANTFVFKWNADKGITGVADIGNVSSSSSYKTKLNGTAGQQAVSVENGVLNFSDVLPAGPVLTLKKVAFGTSTGLAGASFSVTDMGVGNGTGQTLNSTITPLSDTTDGDGTQKFALSMATPETGVQAQRILKIVETKAPDGYVLNETPYYVSWTDSKGVYGVGTKPMSAGYEATGDKVATLVRTATKNSVKTLGYATIGDKSSIYNIAAVRRTATEESGKPVGKVSITLSNPTGTSGTAQMLTTDDVSGSVNVRPDDIANALGLTKDQMKGDVDVRLDVGNTQGLTSPVSRIIRYTFPSSSGGGFAIYGPNGGAGTSSDALKQDDGMVEDSKSDTTVTAGNLDLLLRKDTLNTKAIDENNAVGESIGNVPFTVTFEVGGKSYSKKVSTDDNGQIVLPDPNTLLGQKDLVTPGTFADVTIKQTSAVSGYATNLDTANLMYTTGSGYRSFANPSFDEKNTMTSTLKNGDIMSIQSVLYFFGDSEITFYLTKALPTLNLDSVPDSMNFGQVEAQSEAKDYPLLKTTDDKQAKFDTSKIGLSDPSVLTSEVGGVMSAQVTQTGTYADGWQLQLAVGDLISEDTSDTVSGGTIKFGNYPTVSKDNADAGFSNAGLQSIPSVKMGSTDSTNMLDTGANAQAGVYNLNMNVSDVKMTVPSYSGTVNKNYQAPMTWTINDTPTR